jgi:hypothetical protein
MDANPGWIIKIFLAGANIVICLFSFWRHLKVLKKSVLYFNELKKRINLGMENAIIWIIIPLVFLFSIEN